MKYTHEIANELLKNLQELDALASEFVKDITKYGGAPTRINSENGNIEHEINTACNCHPEYNWEVVANFESFIDWVIEKQTQTKNTK